MKLGPRGFKRSGEESRCRRLREREEYTSSVFWSIEFHGRGQSRKRDGSDQSNVRQLFPRLHRAVARHRFARLRMGTVRQAAHHGRRGRCLAGHAPGNRRERNRQQCDDGEDGLCTTHPDKVITAPQPHAIARRTVRPGAERRTEPLLARAYSFPQKANVTAPTRNRNETAWFHLMFSPR
jgi:hypothetical protein